jgi:hypothetical protein
MLLKKIFIFARLFKRNSVAVRSGLVLVKMLCVKQQDGSHAYCLITINHCG